LEIEINSNDHILLTGPIEDVYSGSFLPDLRGKIKL